VRVLAVEISHDGSDASPRVATQQRGPPNGRYGILGHCSDHSGLIPANLTTLPHFSVSSAMSLRNTAREPASTVPPKSVNRALILVNGGQLTSLTVSVYSRTPQVCHMLRCMYFVQDKQTDFSVVIKNGAW
jgi:hypothetical protein